MNNIKLIDKIFFSISVLIALYFISYFVIYKGYKADKFVYYSSYSGKIENLDKDEKGLWSVWVNNKWEYLGLDGTCIKSIQIGDSIIKPQKSYSIIIKSKTMNYKAIEYDCNKGYHFY